MLLSHVFKEWMLLDSRAIVEGAVFHLGDEKTCKVQGMGEVLVHDVRFVPEL
jgi:hypothetical protein